MSASDLDRISLEARERFGAAAYFIGPNPDPGPRWLLVATSGVVGSTLGKGETPQAALADAVLRRVDKS